MMNDAQLTDQSSSDLYLITLLKHLFEKDAHYYAIAVARAAAVSAEGNFASPNALNRA